MTSDKALHLTFVVGRTKHPQSVIDDLWKRASGVVEAAAVEGTAVYMDDGGSTVTIGDSRLSVVALAKPRPGPFTALLSSATRKSGPVGIAGRLLTDNLESRRVARAVAGRSDLQEAFRKSDIIVAADLTADRSVWQLQKLTDARLVHGPVAMLHALRQIVRK